VSASTLWTADQVAKESASGEPPWDWLGTVYAAFNATLLDEEQKFPCTFGVSAQSHRHNSVTAVDARLPEAYGLDALAASLLAFRERAWQGPRRQSLIAFVGPPEENPDLARDSERFWRLLGDLSALDRAAWPTGSPRDPKDPKWEWCFGGEAWFTFMCSPAYIARRSRNITPCLTVLFQTRRIFEGLSGDTPPGQIAKKTVRERLVAYDGQPPHPHLGSAEQQCDYKWRQYVMPDDLEVVPVDSCPF
jgi:uncharacterized protein